MLVTLSLAVAILFGFSDFFGGLAAKRMVVLRVVAGSNLLALIVAGVASPLIADHFTMRDLLLGVAGGVLGGGGVLLLYRRLAIGPMAVVAPVTALASALVPALWGVAGGERLGTSTLGGVGLALLAIVLVSSSRNEGDARVTMAAIGESVAAGAGFGILFIFFAATDSATAPWPLVGARGVTSVVFITLAIVTVKSTEPWLGALVADRRLLLLVVGAGIGDVAANVFFIFAADQGELAIVSVLSSLYPVSTVTLAWLVLGERMSRVQLFGFGVALAAIIVIAL